MNTYMHTHEGIILIYHLVNDIKFSCEFDQHIILSILGDFKNKVLNFIKVMRVHGF